MAGAHEGAPGRPAVAPGPAPAEAAPAAPRGRPPAEGWWAWPALLAVPVVVALVVASTTTWWPSADEAIFLTRVLDLDAEPATVGVYSRYGWYHPGPALTWWFAGPSWATGGSPNAALLAAVVLKAAFALTAIALVARRHGPVAAATCTAATAVVVAAHPDGLLAVWNPTIVVLVYLAFLWACWCAAGGGGPALVLATAAASVCVQAHAGYATVVLVPSVVAVTAFVVARLRRSPAGPWARRWWPLGAAAGLGLVLWALPLVDQVRGSGNLGALVEHVRESDLPRLGWADGLGVLARAGSPWGPWAGGDEPIGLFGEALGVEPWLVLVPLGALAIAGWSARHRRDRTLGLLVIVVAAAWAGGIVALAGTTGDAYPYLFPWTRALGAALWAVVVLAGVRALLAWRPRWSTSVGAGLAVAAVVAVGVATVATARLEPPWPATSDLVATLAPAALAATERGESVAVASAEPFPGVAEGVAFELVHQGRDVAVPESRATVWSAVRPVDDGTSDLELLVAPGVPDPQLAAAGWEVVASADRLSAEERTRLERATVAVEAALRTAGREAEAVFLDAYPGIFRGDPDLPAADLDALVELTPRADAATLYRRGPAAAGG